ncbi:MAG: MltA domain-containing protein [Sulfurimonas sp.]|nr:MltA domain-containing protein [Sulfurimonas sp.]
MYVGYDNQNGHKYRAIGRYLVEIGGLRLEDVSLQSIREWLKQNPMRVDEVLNYNKSLVYFKERKQGATGALGLELTASRSVAVDSKYIPLGSMLYLHSNIADKELNKIVFAQDTGGAIKGSVRADLFVGSAKEALEVAGKLKSELKLWILLPL